MTTEAQVREALKGVRDPEIGRPIDEIGMLRSVEVDGGVVRVHVKITIEGCPLKDRITSDVTAAVQPLEGVERVDVELTPMSAEERERSWPSSGAKPPRPVTRATRTSLDRSRSRRRPRSWRSRPARAASASRASP